MVYRITVCGIYYGNGVEKRYKIHKDDLTIEGLLRRLPLEKFLSTADGDDDQLIGERRIHVSEVTPNPQGFFDYKELPYDTIIKKELPNRSKILICPVFGCG